MVDERSQQENPERDVKTDRRRPGRVAYSNPALIRMMRGTYDATIHELHQLDEAKADSPEPKRKSEGGAPDRDDLRPARGMAFAVSAGAALWVVIGSAIWVLLRIL